MSDVSALAGKKNGGPPPDAKLKSVFQEFTAGTFYKEMLGAMRKGTGKPAYFHGGYAEDVFRAEMDRHLADDLAAKHGESFTEPLYENFAQKLLAAGRR